MKEPQEAAAQVAVQSTPALDASLVTVALKLAVPAVARLGGGPFTRVIEITGGKIVSVAEIVLVVSAVAVAISVTVLPAGTVAGAVKRTGVPETACW